MGLTRTLTAFGIGAADYARIGADVLDDEVLANTPRMPDAADIAAILTAAQSLGVLTCQAGAPGAVRWRKRRDLPLRHRAFARSVASARPSHFPAEGGSHASAHAREFRGGQAGPDPRQLHSGRGLNAHAGGGCRAAVPRARTGAATDLKFTLNAVSALSASDAWAVGNSARVLHWNGTTWTPATIPGLPAAFPECGAGPVPADVWAVGEAGGPRPSERRH